MSIDPDVEREDLLREKEELRRRMRELRAAIPPDQRRPRSAAVEARLFEVAEVAAAHGVMVFSSFGSELSTVGIVRRLHREGRRVLLPFLRHGVMEAAELPPDGGMIRTSYGPMEPESASPVDPSAIDVAVAPGLAFDLDGYRLGFGGGNYDRYLVRMRIDATLVGIGFDEQLLERIPHGAGDVPLDVIVTDARIVRVRSDTAKG